MMGSAEGKTVGSSDCWEIVHIPEKPPICPDHQPTGIYFCDSLYWLEYMG